MELDRKQRSTVWRRQPAGVALVFYLVICLTLLIWEADLRIRAVTSLFRYLVIPLASSASRVLAYGDIWGDRIPRFVRAEQENQKLHKELKAAARNLTEFQELNREVTHLRALLNLSQSPQYRTVVARVLIREPGHWLSGFLVDKGKAEGISPHLPVMLMDEGREILLGRVMEVQSHSSKVILITDALSAVSARIRRSDETGVIEGSGESTLKMNYLLPDADVRESDEVVSAGLGGAFPSGLLIGRIQKINRIESGAFKSGQVIPAAPLGRLSEVLILVQE